MGWYDDEEASQLPEWAVAPMMWLMCFADALTPALLLVGLCQRLAPQAPAYVPFVAYGLAVIGMIAAVKPWTAR